MMNFNDIFSSNIRKIAQSQDLKFDYPIFETKNEQPTIGTDSVSNDGETDQTAPKIEEKVSEETPIKDDRLQSFADIMREELDSQIIALMEAHRMLLSLEVKNSGISVEGIKRLIEEAVSSSKIIRDRSQGVRVV